MQYGTYNIECKINMPIYLLSSSSSNSFLLKLSFIYLMECVFYYFLIGTFSLSAWMFKLF